MVISVDSAEGRKQTDVRRVYVTRVLIKCQSIQKTRCQSDSTQHYHSVVTNKRELADDVAKSKESPGPG